MEKEDPWKLAIGQDLYKDKANIQSVDPGIRQTLSRYTSEFQVSRDESQGIMKLLFKEGRGHLHDSWKQGFYFDQKIKYGLF